ncbi:MAG: hypothetical protein JWM33_1260 [Caulobacteraceae bacterium]|nr:hypothetical protein [Caulobacteraceae bacterium]
MCAERMGKFAPTETIMTRKALFLLAAASLALAAPNFALAAPAPGPGAAPWLSINQREANLKARINAGVQARTLTPGEADSLRAQLTALERLEDSYRASRGGLDAGERADLDRRFDTLSASIRDQNTDNQNAPGYNVTRDRENTLSGRIDNGSRSGALTASEASGLRMRLDTIRRLDDSYRASAGGMNQRERDDLNQKLNALSDDIDRQLHDNQRAPEWGHPGWNGGSWTVGGRWQTIEQRQDDFNRIIAPGLASGRISRTEESYLRGEFSRLLNLEHRDMAGGLSTGEKADLDRQFNILVQRIRAQAMDNNNGRGTGPGPGPGPGRR